MATSATPIPTRITKLVEEGIITYANTAYNMLLNQFSLRSYLETIDRAYMREADTSKEQRRARTANLRGDKKKIQDITVPIVMPQVEAALGYMANVFTTGYPLFGVAAPPDMEDAALQMETIIAENSITAGWTRQLLMFFRDGLKYNLHGLECEWERKTVAAIETDLKSVNGAKVKQNIWQGNCVRRIDLYNTIFDPRVAPAEIHTKGEFAGYTEIMSRIQMKKFFNDLYGQIPPATVIRALESSLGGGAVTTTQASAMSYYVPALNPLPLINTTNNLAFDWLSWANASRSDKKIQYTNIYEVLKLYARILPSDFGIAVPEANTPQVWKFYIVNRQVCVYAERLTNAHGFIPIFFGQPLEDGLNYQTKSFAQNVTDMQDIASSLWAGYMASKRRLVGDRVLYDPLRIREADINSDSPTAKIPVRPSAYGKQVSESVYQFPFRDEQTNSLIEGSEMVVKFANLINNQNPAKQGQFVKGNKTRKEYEDIMGYGNQHNQVMGLMTEGQVFTPLKETIKLNILQYQPDAVLFNQDKNKSVTIKPAELRKTAVYFKVSDGIIPTDKLMSGEEFGMALQVMGSTPAISSGYEMAPAFSYVMKLRGVDLRPFEKSKEQIQYEQQLNAWQNAFAQVAKARPDMLPADIQKAVGPMPQPPQPQPATKSAQGQALESTAS